MKSPVLAVAPGKVVAVHEQDTGYGLSVEIEHVPSVCTRYARMDTVVVHLHDKLDQNSVIGTVGNTGLSTGPHLHFEVLLLDSVYTSYAKTFSQRAIQRTCTAAANAETVLAYRVAIPRQRLR